MKSAGKYLPVLMLAITTLTLCGCNNDDTYKANTVEEPCENGTCMPTDCQPPFSPCNGKCVNLNSDKENCGECGNVAVTIWIIGSVTAKLVITTSVPKAAIIRRKLSAIVMGMRMTSIAQTKNGITPSSHV